MDKPWEWAPPLANSWRIHGDIKDNWDSMISITDLDYTLADYAAPGGWNDPDVCFFFPSFAFLDARSWKRRNELKGILSRICSLVHL